MDIYKRASRIILDKINAYLQKEYGVSLPETVVCEVPPRPELGDLATNAALVCARPLRQNPRMIAEKFKALLEDGETVKQAEVAGAGFLNVRFADALWDEFLQGVLQDGDEFGCAEQPVGEKINVEFVSANPTGPMHVGHTRGAILGNSISIILKRAGYDVTKEYYVNDHGNQIHNLLESVRTDAAGTVPGPGWTVAPPCRNCRKGRG